MNSWLSSLFSGLQLEIRRQEGQPARIDPSLLQDLKSRGADLVPHANGSLLDHLVRTAQILSGWGARSDLVAAGLFHSVYGTPIAAIKIYAEDERAILQELIGTPAEDLVYSYSTLDRKLVHAPPPRSEHSGICVKRNDQLSDLAVIDMANAVDQAAAADGSPALWIHKWSASARAHQSVQLPLFNALRRIDLSRQSEVAAREMYEHCLQHATLTRTSRRLDLGRVAADLGIAGEPLVVLSYLELRSGQPGAAARSAQDGLRRLKLLGTAWDKRGTLQEWTSAAHAVIDACSEPANEF